MKQKFLTAVCLIVLLMSAACAHAQQAPRKGTALTVVKCREYINLRTEPDTKAEDMCGIPLHDTVVFLEDVNEKFYRVGYQGMIGYVNKKYVIPSEWIYGGQKVYEHVRVRAERSYGRMGEKAVFIACDSSGRELWRYPSTTSYITELTLISGFYGGIDSMPLFMVYNSEKGLTALDLQSGRMMWTLDAEEADAGGSIRVVVDEEGTMYIGGYYGPEPIAISMQGEVLWRSKSNNADAYWLYDLWLTPDSIWAHYEGGSGVEILYDRNTGEVRD